MEKVLEDMIKSAKFPIYLKELQEFLDNEAQKRDKFYKENTEQQKVEFINGETILDTSIKYGHSVASDNLYRLISSYVIFKKLGVVRHERLLINMGRNDYVPDICFFRNRKAEEFHSGQVSFPVPDLIIEVLSGSSGLADRSIKFNDYELYKVPEYWIINADRRIVEQYVLGSPYYELRFNSGVGTIKSVAIEKLEVPINTIFNEEENLNAIQNIFKLV